MKNAIESKQGASVYPALQQILIYQGKVLKDATTLEENNVAENSYVVIMLSKVHCHVTGKKDAFFIYMISSNERSSNHAARMVVKPS